MINQKEDKFILKKILLEDSYHQIDLKQIKLIY